MNDNHDELGRFSEASASAYEATKDTQDVHDKDGTPAQKIAANEKAADLHDKAAREARKANSFSAAEPHEESADAHRAVVKEVKATQAKIEAVKAESESKIAEMHSRHESVVGVLKEKQAAAEAKVEALKSQSIDDDPEYQKAKAATEARHQARVAKRKSVA